ncbi:putative bifunctional diguanylate cyclase/phosphodiesterase [Bradyrhizobium oligotrophicum]|uniref:putative bifunctional diguanylate cyclase/phosphodiesterase n=1 Tax=Bradyrhizobium oligotrophicum TaxID=44255 RepID=UPI003EBC8923
MHKLFKRQLVKATTASGDVDLDLLAALVSTAYEEAEKDRRRTDRSITLMVGELQQANALLIEAFNVVPAGLMLVNARGQYVLFNDRYLDLHDTVRDKIVIGASFVDAIRASVARGHFNDATGREEAWLAERLSSIASDSYSAVHELRDGRWMRMQERRTADGGRIGVSIDITDLKKREQVLRLRSEQLLESQRLGKIGDWSHDLCDKYPRVSAQLYELLGYDAGTSDLPLAQLLSGSGPARLAAAQAEVIRTRQVVSCDIEAVRADGLLVDVIMTCKPVVNNRDEIVGFSGTFQDISERKRAERALERLAFHDPLTGLANRALFHREIHDTIGRVLAGGSQAALLLMDLDHFKDVNDTLGHASGDELLCKVTALISRLLGRDCFFARIGGDEFAIIVSHIDDVAEVERLASRLVATLCGSITLEGGEANIGGSVGVAIIPRDGSTLTDLQRNADLALYRAKAEGRNQFKTFEPGMSQEVQQKIVIDRELRKAVSNDMGLSVHYQPLIGMRTGQVVGFEALMRWEHRELGSIPPNVFIPIAERSQLICDLGLWILKHAALQGRQWLDAGQAPRGISVNVSAAQVCHTDFARDVTQILAETRLPPGLLCLELTETLLADNSGGQVRAVLEALKRLGVILALDDFGAGYSSLEYLRQLPFDRLKIDRRFVAGISRSARARKLFAGMVALGQGLGLETVAEGVEDVEDISVIRDCNCDIGQGFIFGRPAPASRILIQTALAS